MTRRSPVLLERPGRCYVLALGLVAVVLCLLANAGVVGPETVWFVALPLGPLGLVAAVVLLVPASAVAVDVGRSPGLLIGTDLVVLALVLAVAWTNVAIAAGMRRRLAERSVPSAYRGRTSFATDRVLGPAAFVSSAALYVGLTFLAGFLAAVAGGVDVPQPEAQAAALRTACAFAWGVGTVVAVIGLVQWIRTAAKGRAMLRWAAADLAVQTVALAGLVAFTAVTSG